MITQSAKVRKTQMTIFLLVLIFLAILWPGVTRFALTLLLVIGLFSIHAYAGCFYDDRDSFTFNQDTYEWHLKTDREQHAMGECLALQIKARGWVSRGPRDEITARYSDYASRCYDAIKPSAMDPEGKDPETASVRSNAI